LDDLLEAALSRDAADLHLAVGLLAVVRVAGRLAQLETATVAAEDIRKIVEPIIPGASQRELEETGKTEFDWAFRGTIPFRVLVYRQRDVLGAAFRRIPREGDDTTDSGRRGTP
jgi:twitching motility protein PilT